MSRDFLAELLEMAAGDGGSAVENQPTPWSDPGEILQAWSIERGHTIECEMLLNLSRAVIQRLMQQGPRPTPHDLRNSRVLLRQIERRLAHCHSTPT